MAAISIGWNWQVHGYRLCLAARTLMTIRGDSAASTAAFSAKNQIKIHFDVQTQQANSPLLSSALLQNSRI